MGAIYNVSVYVSTANAPPLSPEDAVQTLNGELVVNFSCAPDKIALLEATVHSEVDHLRSCAADNPHPLTASEIR